MIRIIIFLCSLWLPCSLLAQVPSPDVCGSVMGSDAYKDYKQRVQNQQSTNSRNGQTVTLKLQPHIIRRSDGTGGLSLLDLDTSIMLLNDVFDTVGFVFNACTVNYIDNDDYYDEIVRSFDSNDEEYQMAIPNRIPDAINVFFVPNGVIQSGSTDAYSWGTFPYEETQYSKNWIVMTNEGVKKYKTLSHEMGHYFNLLHTHHKFNGLAENVTRNNSDFCYNCETAGDLLCDTPADPRLNKSGALAGCVYQGSFTDNCGMLNAPDAANIMSYAFVCRSRFSQGQIDRMWSSLKHDRTNLANSCSACPNALNITQPVLNGQVDVQSAASTITATNSIFNGASATYRAGNEIVLRPGFEVNMGANFDGIISSCASSIQSSAARTTNVEETLEIEEKVSLTIFPNPATERFELKFSTSSSREFVNIILVNLQGQVVKETLRKKNFPKGDYNVSVSVKDLPAGVYFIRLLTDKEDMAERLVVLKR